MRCSVTEDSLLAKGIRRKNGRSLEEAIDRHGRTVYALCVRILSGLGEEQDVEECVSDTFLAVWQRIGEFDPGRASFRTWVLVLAKYRALDARRRLSGNRECGGADDADVPDWRAESAFRGVEAREALHRALRSLDDLDRELVYRRYYLFESIDQLAEDHGLTVSAVHNRLWRARKAMRARLSPTSDKGVR